MPEFVKMYDRARKWMLYLLAIYVLGWGFTSYQTIFLGLILGTAFSMINLWMLIKRMRKFDKLITNGKKVRSLGSLSRLAMAALAIVIALKWTRYFQTGSVVLGLMTNYIVIMIDYLFHSFNVHKTNRK
ncbi:ATP synthase subunit I [Neobacillus pocheonensis]|uniref:ATP synthase subunit I n=1 Tax=Neobacillus pocheonensis TaxID=363869 RepID=A0ABT0WI20_9BACI|nr:ATP synthase subunit I [Neobacillus pocheonensis]